MPSVTRIGDVDSDGDVMVSGSHNVFANENEAAGQIELDSDTADFFIYTFSDTRQPGIMPYEHASHTIDDEGAPADSGGPSPTSIGEVPLTNAQIYTAAAAKNENVDITTPPTKDPAVPVTPQPPAPASGYTYDDINAASAFPASFPLSPNFTLGALTTQCRVSKYQIKDHHTNGRLYPVRELVRNLRDLCYNILEPLRTMYPGLIINSGFRAKDGGKSQHERGQAADVAFTATDQDASAAFTVAQNIANSSLPYDQFIFEQNNTIWFHVSYDRSKPTQRRMVMSKPRGQAKPSMGLQRAH